MSIKSVIVTSLVIASIGVVVLFGAFLAAGIDYRDAELHGIERDTPTYIVAAMDIGFWLAAGGVVGLVGGGIAARVRRASARKYLVSMGKRRQLMKVHDDRGWAATKVAELNEIRSRLGSLALNAIGLGSCWGIARGTA